MKAVFVFPGQGSQYVGMGKKLWEEDPPSKELFERANEILGFDLARLCFEGPVEELNQTVNAQPAIFLHSIAALDLLKREGLKPLAVAGHSLGEYSALVASGVLSFEEGLRAVKLRGELMQGAGEERLGTMAAIIGLITDQVEELCREVEGLVKVANYNSPFQMAISGEVEAVERAVELAKAKGAKRAIQLRVSGAFHTPLMGPAKERMERFLERLEFYPPQVKFFSTVSAQREDMPPRIRELLEDQITSPVRWTKTVESLAALNPEIFLEVGPGKVLSGLVKRIARGIKVYPVSDQEELRDFLGNGL